jgi:hypothetical protein
MLRQFLLGGCAFAGLFSVAPTPAHAQDASASRVSLEEVVVQARRRSENLQGRQSRLRRWAGKRSRGSCAVA